MYNKKTDAFFTYPKPLTLLKLLHNHIVCNTLKRTTEKIEIRNHHQKIYFRTYVSFLYPEDL